MTFADAVKETYRARERDFPALEVPPSQALSGEKSDRSVAVDTSATKHSPSAETPSVTAAQSPSPVQPTQNIESATTPEKTFFVGQTMRAILRGLRLLFSHLSCDWAVFIMRVVDFVEPLLNGLC